MLRENLPPLPRRMQSLPVSDRGYPIPWFVAEIDGKPEFRAMDGRKWALAVEKNLCWVCGQALGTRFAFVVGPMCGINRISAEPPSHSDCAEFSAMGCPFLSMPKMVRREGDDLDDIKIPAAGMMLERNPGVALLWYTRSYVPFEVPKRDEANPGYLIHMGDPFEVAFYAHGRKATREEILTSIETGLPALYGACEMEKTPDEQEAARLELDNRKDVFFQLIP
jgi:hypothetical protein